ncbi:MAG TPA: type II toxin-antitoxin system RelE/ParE family toxin [Thermoanaerobaculia bacterium]|nr:type II toxin-antitoxin system RelE/ParE family toxin [Thermoanaerobaculia bacterium]
MRRVFKTRHFSRWMRKCGLTQEALCVAISEMEKGLIDAELGGGVVKKRVPLPGRGKSGGTRTLLATNKENLWFFVFGFEKTERANVSIKELQALKEIAADLLKLSSAELDSLVDSETLQEICHEYKNPENQPHPGRGPRNRA